jgi:hypothetical protein
VPPSGGGTHVITGIACGVGVALIGGALAAVKAVRIPVADVFRMV